MDRQDHPLEYLELAGKLGAGGGDRVLTPDGRGRVSLARLGGPPAQHYLARREADGTIILTPALVMSISEVRRMQDGD